MPDLCPTCGRPMKMMRQPDGTDVMACPKDNPPVVTQFVESEGQPMKTKKG